MTNSNYKPTGYSRGRPRKGEVRPPSVNAMLHKQYMDKRKEEDPDYRKKLAAYQKKWYNANIERAREISRNSSRRAKAWAEFFN